MNDLREHAAAGDRRSCERYPNEVWSEIFLPETL